MKTIKMLLVLLGFRIHYKANEVRLQKCRSTETGAERVAPTQPVQCPAPFSSMPQNNWSQVLVGFSHHASSFGY